MYNERSKDFMTKQNKEYYKLYTPCYLIDKKQFLSNLHTIKENFQKEWSKNVLLGYSIKTNHLSMLIQLAQNEGMAAEVVSDDEYYYDYNTDELTYIINNTYYYGGTGSSVNSVSVLLN